jgi:uncharacterized protein YunC (DUF1805 family)
MMRNRSIPDELKDMGAAAVSAIGEALKGAGVRTLHAAADAALEEVQAGVEEFGARIGRVRRRARRKMRSEE